jgi:FkbM family methyltransferase
MNIVKKCRHGEMLFSDHDAYVGKSLSLYGEYSEEETNLLIHAVQEGGIVIEAGANIGSLTVPLSKKVGYKGVVYAFEPQRTTYYALCGNIFINNLKNTFCFQRALGDTTSIVMIPDIDYDFAGNYGAYSIQQETSFDIVPTKVPVEMNRLDDFNLPGCDLLKVDVEGMEIEVLKGALGLIHTHKPILYVENDRLQFRDELYAWIVQQGYQCWQHLPRMYSENNYNKVEDNVFGECMSANLLCLHKESAVKIEHFQSFKLFPGDVKITMRSK